MSVWQISAIQLKKYARKGCQLYAIKVMEIESGEAESSIDKFAFLKEFQNVFPDEVSGLPPMRDL